MNLVRAVVFLVIVGAGGEALAQPSAAGKGEPSGVRASAQTFLSDVPALVVRATAAAPAAAPKGNGVVVPSFVWADGVKIGGVTAGYAHPFPGHPAQVRAGYTRIAAGTVDVNQVSFDGKVQLKGVEHVIEAPGQPAKIFGTTVTALGEFRRTIDTSRKHKAGVAVEQVMGTSRIGLLTLATNVEYVSSRADDADAVRDTVPSAGIGWLWPTGTITSTSFDYVVKNDVDGEDSYSITFYQRLSNGGRVGPIDLAVGGGKHKLFFAALVVPFR